jgi:hypothetical protein
MKALLIDPFLQDIAEIEISGDLNSLHKAIGCDCIDGRLLDTGEGHFEREVLFVDDVGMERPGQRFFTWATYDQPLAGRGLVLGVDDSGNNTDTAITLDAARDAVDWPDIEFSHHSYRESTIDFFGSPMAHLEIKAHFRPRR